MKQNTKKEYLLGMHHGIPIGLGYFAVSFSLGIFAAQVGINAIQGFFASLFTLASAGEFVGFTLFGMGASYWNLIAATFITNVRYLLMSSALSQKMSPSLPLGHRLGMGTFVTDEIFGMCISHPGTVPPAYMYGLATVSALPWAAGTALGIVLGNILPVSVTSALSVALYGMFLSIILPTARTSKPVLLAVAVSLPASWLTENLPLWQTIGEGFRILILTVLIAGVIAAIFPVPEEVKQDA